MKKPEFSIVIDTNVFVAALKSKQGASYKLLFDIDWNEFVVNISPPLVFEYESVVKRMDQHIALSHSQIDAILDMICKRAKHSETFYLWRPLLKDPKDDFILELAIESRSNFIITYNKTDFKGSEKFGVTVLTPKEFLQLLGEIK